MIKITFPDGQVREFEKGITPYQVALQISEGLARNVLAANLNGEVVDSSTPIDADASLQLLTWNDTEGKKTFGIHQPIYLPRQLRLYFQVLNLVSVQLSSKVFIMIST